MAIDIIARGMAAGSVSEAKRANDRIDALISEPLVGYDSATYNGSETAAVDQAPPAAPSADGTYVLNNTVANGTGTMSWENALGIPYLTTAPASTNTSDRIIVVVLSAEPVTKYDGYLYIITGA